MKYLARLRRFNFLYLLLMKGYAWLESFIAYHYESAVHPTIAFSHLRNYNRNRIKGPKKIICNAPFKHLYFTNRGELSACCMTKTDSFGNIQHQSIGEIWKSEKAAAFRDRIRNYNLSGGCNACKYAITSGSHRNVLANMYDDFLPVTEQQFPSEMTFELSNECNLECTMCQGEYSSLIRLKREGLPAIANPYTEEFYKELKTYLPHLKVARFIGGEPFLINTYYRILDDLAELNPHCKIQVQTNGTILNNKVRRVLSSKNIELSISVDSLKKTTYESIRVNSNFEKTMANILFFIHRAKEQDQCVNINYCLMNNNWDELPGIIDFCLLHHCTLTVIPVEYPLYSSLRSLHAEKLAAIYSELKAYEPVLRKRDRVMHRIFSDALNYIDKAKTASKERETACELLEKNSTGELLLKFHSLVQVKLTNEETQKLVSIINTFLSNTEEEDKRRILSRFLCEADFFGEESEFYMHDSALRQVKFQGRLKEIYAHLSHPEYI